MKDRNLRVEQGCFRSTLWMGETGAVAKGLSLISGEDCDEVLGPAAKQATHAQLTVAGKRWLSVLNGEFAGDEATGWFHC